MIAGWTWRYPVERLVTLNLFYDGRDDELHEARGSRILYWLDDLGAIPLAEARSDDDGFLFAGARDISDYTSLVARYPLIRDRPGERRSLMTLDSVLKKLATESVNVPTAKTWYLKLDKPIPDDLEYPLFLRTDKSSWKLGGRVSRVQTREELESESAELRRALGWDAMIMARTWLDFANAGESVYGPVPQELRVWIVDQLPYAWSFHYLNVVSDPIGFPPGKDDLRTVAEMASKIGSAFESRLVAADFARLENGTWSFVEAGPGSCAGTAHEFVFKAVAKKLCGETVKFQSDKVGGIF